MPRSGSSSLVTRQSPTRRRSSDQKCSVTLNSQRSSTGRGPNRKDAAAVDDGLQSAAGFYGDTSHGTCGEADGAYSPDPASGSFPTVTSSANLDAGGARDEYRRMSLHYMRAFAAAWPHWDSGFPQPVGHLPV